MKSRNTISIPKQQLQKKMASIFKLLIVLVVLFTTKTSFSQITFDTLFTSSEFNSNMSVEEVNGKIVFTGKDAEHGTELWVSDGTWNGTKLLKDIYPGIKDSRIRFSQKINSKLYFGADDGTHGFEIWETDGTEIGTKMSYDTRPGALGTLYYFHYLPNTEIYKNKLWSYYDSGIAGYDFVNKTFTELKFASLGIKFPQELRLFNDKIYFTAATKDSGIRELWFTQGTLASTQKVFNFKQKGYKVTGICDFNGLQTINNKLLFAADNTNNGCEIQVSDGTEGGTSLLQDINPGLASGRPGTMFSFKNNIYFANTNGILGSEIFITDGTPNGTKMLKDINPGTASGASNFYIGNNDILYFIAHDTSGIVLYKTNGTENGTEKVTDLGPSPINFELSNWVFLNNKMYVIYSTNSGANRNHELYNIDINSGLKTKLEPNGINNLNPCYGGTANLLSYNNSLYFSGQYKGNKTQLWKVTFGDPNSIFNPFYNTLRVYPNPSNGKITLENTSPIGNARVFNTLGQIVYETYISDNYLELTIGKPGIYIIQTNNGESIQTQKVIIHD